jgi:large subunit ribosomal protein L17
MSIADIRTTPDNLELVEGIGPKIAGVLSDAGIVSFAQLAATEIEELRQALSERGVRIAFPDT